MSELSLLSGLKMGATATSGTLDYFSSVQTQRNYESQAKLLTAESEAEVSAYKSEAEAYKASQKSAYLKSGVQVSGTVLDTLDETVRTAREKISAMRASTAAQVRDLKSKGLTARLTGRLAFISAINTGLGDLSKAKSPTHSTSSASSGNLKGRTAAATSTGLRSTTRASVTGQAVGNLKGRERGLSK